MKIADIKIENRVRKDLGNIDSLVASIKEVGLLHPIVVQENNVLIAGWRRIAAFKRLGRNEIPHTIVTNLSDALTLLKAERDENTERKDFLRSESVALAALLEPMEKQAAKERQKEHGNTAPGKSKNTSDNLTEVIKGEARNKMAEAVGMSPVTLDRAKAVVKAAEEDPENCGPIKDQMDKTGNVAGAYNAVKAKGHAKPKRPPLKSTEERIQIIRSMAERGFRIEHIAEKAGIGKDRVHKLAKEHGIKLPEVSAHKHIDINRIIEQTVLAAEGLSVGLEMIDNEASNIDSSRITDWISRLKPAIPAINGLIKKLERRS